MSPCAEMRPDIAELEAFYASRLGQVARRLIGHQLRQLWPELRGEVVAGIGYPAPFLSCFDSAERAIGLVPAATDTGVRPGDALGRVALCREDDLPVPDRSIDRLFLAHALELSAQPARLMREVWRVLADGGRLVAIVPNRRGLWCLSERTPFGHGQPYSPTQLARMLRSQLFEPGDERGALYVPPFSARVLLRLAVPTERLGLSVAPHFAGVILVEAEKQIIVGTPALEGRLARARRYVAVPRGLVTTPARTRTPVGRAA